MHSEDEISLLSTSPEMTRAIGEIVASVVSAGDCIPLLGNMGSGKTTFVQGVARGLGVPDSNPVASPSFTLINQYRGNLLIHHVDLYRLNTSNELSELELDELLRGDSVVLLEWPQLILPVLPIVDLIVRFEWRYDAEFYRYLSFQTCNHRFKKIFTRLSHDFSGH